MNSWQRRKISKIIATRLADDRNIEECRNLVRYCVWIFFDGILCNKPTLEVLQETVSQDKLLAIIELENAIKPVKKQGSAILLWIEKYSGFPIIEDRGYKAYKDVNIPYDDW